MYRAEKDIGSYIGGTMRRWKKGDVIELDQQTIEQNFEPGDYELVKPMERKSVETKNKKKQSKHS